MMQKSRKKFKVTKEDAGTRLDVFLVGNLPDFSRAWVQKLIEKGNVKVGAKKPAKNYKLKPGENVFVNIELPPEILLAPEKSTGAKIKVVFANKNFVVINKPSGLVVHPSQNTPKGTLVNWLLYKYPNIKNLGDDPIRPGIVHRLDKETSGLMVVALNQKTQDWLKDQFRNRKVEKKYQTLVVGDVKKESGEINYPIARSKSDPTKQIVYKGSRNIPENAREAYTLWRVIKHFPGSTQLEIVTKTGRMHQIRVHLRSIGHPVVGDKKYSPKKAPKATKHIGRMFLHASYLSFFSKKGEKFSFTSPLPQELAKALKNLAFMLD